MILWRFFSPAYIFIIEHKRQHIGHGTQRWSFGSPPGGQVSRPPGGQVSWLASGFMGSRSFISFRVFVVLLLIKPVKYVVERTINSTCHVDIMLYKVMKINWQEVSQVIPFVFVELLCWVCPCVGSLVMWTVLGVCTSGRASLVPIMDNELEGLHYWF